MNYKIETHDDGSLRISVGNEDGKKYTFVKPDPTKGPGYGVSILRYGERWVEQPPGANAIMDLMRLVEELHGQLTAVRDKIDAAVENTLAQVAKSASDTRTTTEMTPEEVAAILSAHDEEIF